MFGPYAPSLPPKKRELGTGTSHGSLRRSMKTDRPRRHWEPVKFCFQSRKITVSSHEEIQLMAPVDSFSREDTRKPETPLNMGMYLGLSSWWLSISISSLDSLCALHPPNYRMKTLRMGRGTLHSITKYVLMSLSTSECELGGGHGPALQA